MLHVCVYEHALSTVDSCNCHHNHNSICDTNSIKRFNRYLHMKYNNVLLFVQFLFLFLGPANLEKQQKSTMNMNMATISAA